VSGAPGAAEADEPSPQAARFATDADVASSCDPGMNIYIEPDCRDGLAKLAAERLARVAAGEPRSFQSAEAQGDEASDMGENFRIALRLLRDDG
jgi:hypothetical protein